MGNPTQAFGLRPVRHEDGSPWNGATVPCYVDSDYATALYVGDPVALDSTAANKHAVANIGEGLLPTVMKVALTSSQACYGVITSFQPADDSTYSPATSPVYRPASTARIANVCRDPSVIYEIRGCGQGTPVAGWINRNALCVAGSGSTATGLSGTCLDEGTATAPRADQTYPLLIVGASSKPGETPLDDYTLWEVKLNTHYNTTGLVLGVSGS